MESLTLLMWFSSVYFPIKAVKRDVMATSLGHLDLFLVVHTAAFVGTTLRRGTLSCARGIPGHLCYL